MSDNYGKVSDLIKWQLHTERLHIDLDKYKLSDNELADILSQIKDSGRKYVLRRSSDGSNSLTVYWKPDSRNTIRVIIGCSLMFIALMISGVIHLLLILLVWPLWTVTSRLIDGHWVMPRDFLEDWIKIYDEE